MVDITMCSTIGCPLAEKCRRKTAPDGERQSYDRFKPTSTDAGPECEYYLPDYKILRRMTPDKPEQAEAPMSIADQSPVMSVEWEQAACGNRSDQGTLRLSFIDEGDGAYFGIDTGSEGKNSTFYFDSADDLRKLADLVETLMPAVTAADVY